MGNKTILMVEDNAQILHTNREMLIRLSGGAFTILTAETLNDARALLNERLDLILLDIMLPDGSGLDFVHEIRAVTSAPILMLTSRREPEQIVEGLMGGGDEYMTKPYRINELYARIAAMLRREELHRSHPPERSVTRGALTLDAASSRAFLHGKDMLLTPKEFAVLYHLVQNESRAVSARELYEAVWGLSANADTRVVKDHISKLRGKLSAAENTSVTIATEYGSGYRIDCRDF